MKKLRGCTMWPEGNWYDCCVQHDLDYERGGSLQDKIKCDHKLGRCVAGKSSMLLGLLMFAGVMTLGVGPWYQHRYCQPKPPEQTSPYFDFFGQERFRVFVSYFDAMRARYLIKDLNFLKSKGIDGIRVYLNFAYPNNKPFHFLFRSDGGLDGGRLKQLRTLLTVTKNKQMVVDITASRRAVNGFQMSVGAYQQAWTKLAQHLKSWGVKNVIIDIENEHNCSWKGKVVMSESRAKSIKNAIRIHLPDVPLTASVACGISPAKAAAMAKAEEMSVLAYHDLRNSKWVQNTGRYASQSKAAAGKSIKVYFQEPALAGGGNFVKSADDLLTALDLAKKAKIAGWALHTAAGFDLSGGSFESQLLPVEKEFFNRLDPGGTK